MPKDTSKATDSTQRRVTRLKKVLDKDTYDRLRAERETTGTHTLTTAQLVELIDKVTNAQPTPDTRPDNAAETARLRNQKQAQHRQELLERIAKNPPPPPAPIAGPPQPLNDFKRTVSNDRAAILRKKLESTLTRLRAFNEVGNERLFVDSNGQHVQSFQRGFRDLNLLLENLDAAVPKLSETEWKSLNWGFTAIGRTKFNGLRKNFGSILKDLSSTFDSYFSFISVDK